MIQEELLEPKRQRAWGLPAVAYFILGGTGAGLYLFFSACGLLESVNVSGARKMTAEVLSPVLVCLGFLALTIEAGRPMRAIYMLRNIRRSWVSVEVLAGAIFTLCAVTECFVPGTMFRIATAGSALMFAISQGFVINRSRAIPAWSAPVIPALFVFSGLTMGGGLLLTADAVTHGGMEDSGLIILLVCLTVVMVLWCIYLMGSGDEKFSKATAFLRRPLTLFLVIGMGLLFPMVVLAALVIAGPSGGIGGFRLALLAAGGLSVLAGGASQKAGIILGASFFREVTMGRETPQEIVRKQEGAGAEEYSPGKIA